MSISIIIVNFNTKQILENCLGSIIKNRGNYNIEIIVVDNGSKDGSIEMIKSDFPSIKLIANTYNTGFGYANNQGIKIAKEDYLLFLNSDTLIIDGFFDELTNKIRELKNPGIIGFKILNPDKSLQNSGGNFPTLLNLFIESIYLDRIFKGSQKIFYRILHNKYYDTERKADWVSGSCFLIKKDLIKKIGGFDEKYFLYMEDVDLCYRIKKVRYDNIYLPIKAAYHFNRSSTPNKTSAIIFSHHNFIYFFKKNYSTTQALFLKILFILKSIIYFITGLIMSILSRKFWNRTKSYLLLFLTLISEKKFIQYENSFKK